MVTFDKDDLRYKILDHLNKIKRPLSWISHNCDLSYSTIYGLFKQGTIKLTKERLNKINKALGTDFKFDKP